MKPYILAIDIGTSGAKLLLLEKDTGAYFAQSESYPTYAPQANMAEHDPNLWYEAVKRGIPPLLSKAHITADEICAIGVDGISWSPVLLDEKGNVICRSPIWYDTRADKECVEMNRAIGEDTFFGTSGNPNQPYYIYPKWKWIIKHGSVDASKVRHILSCNGYIGFRLTGRMSQDISQAYGWCFFDMEHGTWDEHMAELLGLDLSLLPRLCECTQIIGAVSAKAAKECGLSPGIPVVAGGLDAACGAVGAGVIAPAIAHEQSGSAGGMSICETAYRPVRNLILSRHVVPGTFLLQGGTVGGGNLIKWLDTLLFPETSAAYQHAHREALTKLAAIVPPGSEGITFLPYMAGERSPIWNPYAKGVYYGLNYSTTRGHMMRSVLEGAAYALNHNLDLARKAGVSIGMMRSVGGASTNALWMQIKADITNENICAVDSPESTAIGCAIVAGVGCGVYDSFESATEKLPKIGKIYTPIPENRAIYQEGYQRYLSLVEKLSPMMKG